MLVHRMGTMVWITVDTLINSASDLHKHQFSLVDEKYFATNLQGQLAG
jgi:hypothetical protein